MNSVITLNSSARKTIRIKYLGLLLGLLSLTFYAQATNPVVTTLGNVSGCPGQDVLVPMTVTGFTNITGISITIRYDTSQLIGVGIQNLNSSINNNFLSYFSIQGDSGYLAIAAYTVSGSMTLASGSLMLNIKFTIKNKPVFAGVSFDLDHAGICEYADNTPGTPLPIPSVPGDWISGSVYTQPSFSQNPSNLTITPGANGYFFVSTMGTNSYQWQKSSTTPDVWSNLTTGAPYGDVTNDTLFITNAIIGMSGYKYRCITTSISGGCPVPYNVATSKSAVLTVAEPCPTVYNVTGGGSYCPGGIGVHVFLSGSQTGVNYQLKLNGSNSGAVVPGTGNAIDFGLKTVAGTYTVAAINSNACSPELMSLSAVVSLYNTTSANVTSNSPVGGVCGGALTAVTYHLNGVKPFTFVYNDGTNHTMNVITHNDTTIFVNPLSTTTYTMISSTDGHGCAMTITGTAALVTVKATPTAVATSNSPLCTGGTLNLSSSGTTGAISLSWTFGATPLSGSNPSISNVTLGDAGVYTLLATGANGCTATATANVLVNTVPSAAGIVSGPATACKLSSQTYSVPAIAGAITYAWTLPTGASIVGNSTGNSIVVLFSETAVNGNISVSGHSNCGDGASSAKAVTVSDAPVASATNSGPACVGSALNLTSNGGSTYAWSGPNSFTSTVQNPAFASATSLNGGLYTVTVTGSTGCTKTATTTVVVNTNPTASAGASPNPVCSGSILSLSSSGGTSYSWAGPSSYMSTVQNPTFVANLGSTGTYNVTVTNTSTGCKSTANVSVTVNSAPTVIVNNNNPCEGTFLNLTSSGGTSYSWSGPNGYTSSLQNPSIASVTTGQAGTYNVLVTGANTCTKTGSTTVVVKLKPSPITASSNAPVCEGGTLNLSSSGGVGYLWSGPSSYSATVQNPAAITNATAATNAGTYNLTVTGSNSCSATTSTNVTFNPNPVANAGSPQTILSGATATLSGSGSGGSGSYSYNWQPAASFVDHTLQNPTTVAVTSNTSFSLIVTDLSTGCISSQSTVNITVSATPPSMLVTSSVSPSPFCLGATLNLSGSATGGSGSYSYSWTGPNGFASTIQNPQIINASAAAAGTYNLSVNDGVNTVNATPFIISHVTNPNIYTLSGNTTYCTGTAGGNIYLDGSELGTTYFVVKGGNNYTLAVGTGSPLTIEVTAGTYTMKVSTSCGDFPMNGQAIVTAVQAPTAFLMTGGGLSCNFTEITVGLAGSQIGYNYDFFKNGVLFTTISGTGSPRSFVTTEAGSYTAKVTSICGTTNMTGSSNVQVGTAPSLFTVSGGGNYCSGTNGPSVLLSGSATGVTYQLLKDGVASGPSMSGTGNSINFGSQTAGVYTVSATNPCGTFTMTGSATIIQHTTPSTFTVTGGSGADPICDVISYAIGLSGSQSGVKYVLHHNGSLVGDSVAGSGSAFSFGSFSVAGTYTVTATGAGACTNSNFNSVSIVLISSPVIVSNPTNQNILEGANTSFNASGTNAATYTWYVSSNGGSSWTAVLNGGIYAGAGTSTLTLTSVPASLTTYQYRCTLANGSCSVNTTSATLTVTPSVVNTTVSFNQMNFCPGQISIPVNVSNFNGVAAISMVFNFNASALTYVGVENVNAGLLDPSNLLVNPSSNSIFISHYVNTSSSNVGNGVLFNLVFQYSGGNSNLNWDLSTPGNCELSGANSIILSSTFFSGSVTQSGYSPIITSQPANTTVNAGLNASFHLTATGATSYQWQTYTSSWNNIPEGSPYTGTQTANLQISGVSLAMNGNLYRAVVKENICQLSSVSEQAVLGVNGVAVDFITTAGTSTACIGTSGSVPVSVSGMPNVSAISLTVNYDPSVIANLSYTNLNAALAGGSINVNNVAGDWRFSWYQITPISISSGNLFDITFDYLGGTTDLSWDLVHPGNCEYDNADGNPVPAIFVNGNVGPVPNQAMISSQPSNVSVSDGNNATFNVVATNASTYQWQLSTDGFAWGNLSNGGIYSGSNTATLHITPASAGMTNSYYRCVVNAGNCPATSTSAKLTVTGVVQEVITTAGSGSACAGSDVLVPVGVQFASNIAAISLTLQYNPASLAFVDYENLNSQLAGGSINTFNLPGEWRFSWYSITPINIASGNLFDLKFNYLGGSSDLVWDVVNPGNCEYDNFDGNVVAASYINGHVGPSATLAVVSSQPMNTSVIDGNNASFSVVASNATTYQWQVSTNGSTWSNLADGGIYSGVNTANLQITPASITMNGYDYRVIINGSGCGVTSESANLNVMPLSGTVITTAGSTTACSGIDAIVPVNAQNLYNVAAISLSLNYNPSVISYLSYENLNAQLAGGNMNVFELPGVWKFSWYSISPINLGSGKLFDLKFNYMGGSTDLVWDLSVPGYCEYDDFDGNILPSSFVNGHIGPAANQPVISSQPVSANVVDGTNTSFSIVASNATSYQWYVSPDGGTTWNTISNGGNYSGATSANLSITPASISMNGLKYKVWVGGDNCSMYSSVASLTVTPFIAPIITTAGNTLGCPQNAIVVPVNGQYIYNIAALSLDLKYDPSVLTYTGYHNLDAQLTTGSLNIFNISGEWRMSWYSITPINIGNAKILDLDFTYLGGTSNLTWDLTVAGNNEYDDFDGNILPASFVNGSVGPNGTVPAFSSQPANVTVNHHDNTSFHVVVSPATSYQWQISTNGGTSWSNLANGGFYSGATTADLGITNALYLLNGYKFRCDVINNVCSATSNAATLTVLPVVPFNLTTYAPSMSICPGTDIVVPITVTDFYNVAANSLTLGYNTTVLSYTGFQNLNPAMSSALISGTPGEFKFSWYSITPLSLGDATLVELLFHYNGGSTNLTWDVATTGNCEYNDFDGNILLSSFVNGSVSSSAVAPVITSQPSDLTSFVGAPPVTFSVAASGASSYQWQVSSDGGTSWANLSNVAPYSGTNSTTLGIADLSLSLNGNKYRAIANGTCTLFATSNPATLTVYSLILTTIGSVDQCAGSNFNVPVSVQHLYNVGAISLTLNYNSADVTYVGYQNLNPAIDPASLLVNAIGGQVKISYSSLTPLNFGDGQLLSLIFASTGSNSSLTWDNVTAGNCEYVNYSNSSVINSQYVNGTVVIYPLTAITTQAADVISYVGNDPATFSVNAVNATAYQWQVSTDGLIWTNLSNTAPYSGANTNTLSISPVSLNQTGNQFRVVASGFCAPVVTGTPATLTVYPGIITTAGSVTHCIGSNFIVPVTVQDLYHVGAISLTLDYNATTLTYIGYQNLNAAIDPSLLLVNAIGGQIKISYSSLTPLNFDDGLVLDLIFSSAGGTSNLTWDNLTPGNCEYVNLNTSSIIPSQYVNGTVVANMLTAITSNPVNVTLDETSTATFNGNAVNATSYQWQVSADGGSSWSNLTNNAVYAGVTTNSLVLTGITLDMSANQYRLVASGLCAPDAVSTAATLTVTPIIKTIAGTVTSCAGNAILVPVSVEHLLGVGALSLSLNYDASVLTYVGYQNANSLFDPNILMVNAVGGQVKIAYFNANPLNIGNGLMLNLIFSSTGGNSNLTWDVVTPANCEYINSNGNNITSTYVNGSLLVHPLPVITYNNIGPFCVDAATFTMTALPGGGTFSGAGVSGNNFNPATAGVGTWPVSYSYTDQFGCSNSKTISVVVNPLPVVSLDAVAPICVNGAAHILVGHPSGGTFSGTGVVNNVFNPAIAGLGTHTITYTYSDGNGCTNFSTTTVLVNPIPVVNIGTFGPFCSNNAPVLLSGTPAGGSFSGTGVVGNMFNPSIAGAGTWTVTYTYADGNACINSASTQILVNQLPTAFPVFGGGEYCAGGNGLNVGTGGSQTGFQYYLYLNGVATGQVLTGTGSILNFGLQHLAGDYTVYAMNPGTGCNNWLAGSVHITINPLPNVYGGGYTIVCQGTSTTLNATVNGGTAPYLYNWTPASGLSSANVLNPIATPQTTTFYQLLVTDSKGCSSTDNALVVVNAAPVVSAGPDKVINVGMITPLNATVSGGHAPYTYLWTPATGLNNAASLNPLASPAVTTTYTLLVTDNIGCTGTDQVVVTVSSTPLGYNINGFVTYDNVLNSPMKNTNVILKQSNVTLSTTLTDVAGSYGFNTLANGTYTLSGSCSKAWGGGNSVDALLMARHFVGLQPLTGLRLLAGDLNGDGVVNAADALLVMRRSVLLVNSFVVGDWIFEKKTAVVNNGNLTVDFKALCFGDINGSNTNIPALKVSPSVNLETRGSLTISNDKEFELPIRAGQNLALGAASLVIDFPANAIDIVGVKVGGDSKTTNLVYQVLDGKLSIEWYNLEGLVLVDNDILFTLNVKVKDINAISNLNFTIEAESQLGDPTANVLDQSVLTMPKLQLISGIFSLGNNYPNPFKQFTTINYTIPESGKVSLSVFNLLGEKVADIVNASQDAGSYIVSLDELYLQQGVYTYRLRLDGKSNNYEQSKRMVITR